MNQKPVKTIQLLPKYPLKFNYIYMFQTIKITKYKIDELIIVSNESSV